MESRDEKQFLNKLMRRIAKVRKEKSVTQENLASETGLDRVAIANIETGKRRPTVRTMYKIAKALDIEVSELFKKL